MPVKNQSKKQHMKQTKKSERLSRSARTNRTERSSGNVGKHNKNLRINRWHVDHMKEYHNTSGNVLVKQLAWAWNVLRSKLLQRIMAK